MRETPDIQSIRDSVERIGRLSDGLIRFGPFSLGLDGILSWVPGLGEVYSAGAAAFILIQGARARVPAYVLFTCAALMGGRTVISAIPLAGPAMADVLTAHKWSARMVVRAIDKQLGVATPPRPKRRSWAGFGEEAVG